MAKLSIDEVKKGNLGMFSLIAGGLAVLLGIATIIGRIIVIILNFVCCLGCLLTPFLCLANLAGIILALSAIVIGIIALVSKKKESKGMAGIGIGLGVLYFIIQIVFYIIVVIVWGFSRIIGN